MSDSSAEGSEITIFDIVEAERSLREMKLRFIKSRGWRFESKSGTVETYSFTAKSGDKIIADLETVLNHLGYTSTPLERAKSIAVQDIVKWNDGYHTVVAKGNMAETFDIKSLFTGIVEHNISPDNMSRVIEM